jgi:protein-disulfide isomerase
VRAALLVLVACASNTQALEGRVDELARRQKAEAELAPRVDALAAEIMALKAGEVVMDDKLAMLAMLAREPPPIVAPPRRHELDPAKVWAIGIDNDPVIGPADAKVTLIETMDYACPFCEKLREPFAQLRTKYGKDLRIVYKPFIVHPAIATSPAMAACAAARQGKFAELNELVWETMFKGRKFETDADCRTADGGCPILDGLAKQAKLALPRFKQDMLSCRMLVESETRTLQTLGVAAIPTSFVNGRVLIGAMPIDRFEALIDEELKLANERISHGAKQATYYVDWVVAKGQGSPDPP